ncbi:SanA/YdcF family protein [Cerasicoccus arenae]|uniref:Protein SanA n=1 Tax=Cerasicoccus arenae TaxID=424488 RepID=A0A8J3DDS2_9BACT|nr:ElyC/SanA/YdcF family protein [Cerasicoccus arenae]MBK1858740.1 YdcF family protein [Cerasicoccus arenae]GHC07240.1 protein SanA [Cerasicoccus arenae]
MITRAIFNRIARRCLIAGGVGVMVAGGLIWKARATVAAAAEGRVATDIADVASAPVGLVLGTSPTLSNGRANLYFEYRMDAAAALFRAGKVERLLVSGANPTNHYDESTAMKLALIKRGVPSDYIARDYAGFRTLDSVVRAKEIFGCNDVLIISQGFHVERALYLAQENGMDATGFAARDVPFNTGIKTNLREELARVKAVLDVQVLDTRPKYLGREIYLLTAN